MRINKQSLLFHLLMPIIGIMVIISVALLVLVSRISTHILDDYYHATLSAYGAESKRIMDAALADLTTARLLENHMVVEVKQRTVIEAIELNWRARGLEGVVIGPDNSVLLSTVAPDLTRRILARPANGNLGLADEKGTVHGQTLSFPPWQWKVITLTRAMPGQRSQQEVLLLVPLVALGLLLMFALLYLVVQRRLQRPVAAMVDDVRSERAVSPTGVAEFDQIGASVNDAIKRVMERTAVILERDERIRHLLQSTAEGIIGMDRKGDCTFCNPAALTLLKYEREEELLGRNTHSLFHHTRADGSAYPEHECKVHSAYRGGGGVHVDNEVFWRRDGSSFPVEYWSHPVLPEGLISGAIVTFIDITERKQRDTLLREEKNKIEAIIAAMGDGLSIQDRNFRVQYQNDVHKGYVGSHIGELCYEAFESRKDVCAECPVALTFQDGKVHMTERTLERPGGARHYEITASPLFDGSGAIVAGIELVRDVTERKRTEAQLRHAQKMEAVGQLAGGIAHDFNNILTAITGYTSFIRLKSEENSQIRHYSEQVLSASGKAASLTRQILAFSRKQVITRLPVCIDEVVRGMEKMIFRLLGEDIDIHIQFTDQDTTVLADAGQLEQVLLNLATNARDAMPAGGSLRISTEIASLDEAHAREKGLAKPGQFVLISFSDTGEGMSEKVRQRIFEPFFTTKEMGRGTGLGLSIIYGIVTQHEGHISVYSEPGEGTSFRIYLPLAGQHASAAAVQEEAAAPGGSETILLAEDDAQVREIAEITLTEAGYRVIVAVDGEEAVQKFREHGEAIQLCLFDLVMPKKNGKAALQEIRSIRKDVRAILMSGYASDILQSKDLAEKNVTVLDKPLVPQDLLRRIRKALDA